MYPPYDNEDANLFLYSENFYINPISTNHENLTSNSSLLDYFPCSPLTSYGEDAILFQQFHDILHQNIDVQDMVNHEVSDISTIGLADEKCCSKNSTVNNKVNLSSSGGSENHQQQIRRRTRRCKKDRHSKIVTANGSRGRRMRLSIDAAKEFFALQDLLGFNTASKTVQWLLKKSKNSIKDLNHSSRNSSTSVLSAVDEVESEVATKQKTREAKGVRKLDVFHPLARKQRENARARARERTLEKKRLRQMNLGSCKPFLSGEKSVAGTKHMNTSNPANSLPRVEDLLNYREETVGDSFFITNNWNPLIFPPSENVHHDHEKSSETTYIYEGQLITAFQYDGKSWEEY